MSRRWLVAACAVAMCLPWRAHAHQVECVKTVNGEVVHEIASYPATLEYEIRVVNTDEVPSTVVKVEDPMLEGLGWAWPVPFTLDVGGSARRTFVVTVRDQAECEGLASGQMCGGTAFDNVARALHDSGEAQCRARVICKTTPTDPGGGTDGGPGGGTDGGTPGDTDGGPGGGTDGGTPGDTDGGPGGGTDGGTPGDTDGGPGGGTDGGSGGTDGGTGGTDGGPAGGCDAASVRRGLGFWMNHAAMVEACAAHGPIDLGTATATTVPQFMGILWGEPARYPGGGKRSRLDEARFLLQRELLVATCNVRVFGALFRDPAEPARTVAKLVATDCVDIQAHHVQLDAPPACPGAAVDPGPVTPQENRAMAADPTTDSTQRCTSAGGRR